MFKYQADENDVKYNALKVENIFRFQNTFKAIRWGIFVGGLFGAHRYYRSRDIQNALTWFCTVSGISFFNIWVSYGLQEFVTQHGTTKGLQTAARSEYHTNAYKSYLERQQEQIQLIDRSGVAQPVLRNSQSESMDLFVQDLERSLHRPYNSGKLVYDEIFKADGQVDFIALIRDGKLDLKQFVMIKGDVERAAFMNLYVNPRGKVRPGKAPIK